MLLQLACCYSIFVFLFNQNCIYTASEKSEVTTLWRDRNIVVDDDDVVIVVIVLMSTSTATKLERVNIKTKRSANLMATTTHSSFGDCGVLKGDLIPCVRAGASRQTLEQESCFLDVFCNGGDVDVSTNYPQSRVDFCHVCYAILTKYRDINIDAIVNK